MSVQVMGDVWKHSSAAGNDLLLLLAMADHADDKGVCWPSIAQLADKTRVSESTIKRSIKTLVDLGELKIEEAGGTFFVKDSTKRLANRYRLLSGKRLYQGENLQDLPGGQNEPRGHSDEPGPGVTAMDSGRGSQLWTPNRHKEPSKETSTITPRAHAQESRLATEEVVVVSSVSVVGEKAEAPANKEVGLPPSNDDPQTTEGLPEDNKTTATSFPSTLGQGGAAASDAVQAIATEFGLGIPARGEVCEYVERKGLAYVQEKAALTRSRPCDNLGGYFMAALRKDYQMPKSTKPVPKPKAAEPCGWQEWLLAKYPACDVAHVKAMSWKGFGELFSSERSEFLAQQPPVASIARPGFSAAYEAVRNVGKQEAA
jgi:hypothetical protein